MSDDELQDFIDRTVERVCPPPRVVSDTAVEQLRPVFVELYAIRLSLARIIAHRDSGNGEALIATIDLAKNHLK